MNTKQLYTVEEVAGRLNLHAKTVRRFIREGRLPAKRIGKEYRITRSALDEFSGAAASPRDGAAARTRRVIVSAIVDVDAIGPEEGQRITTLVMAALNVPRDGADLQRVDSLYDEERGRLRVMITGSPALTCDLVRTIAALSEGNRG